LKRFVFYFITAFWDAEIEVSSPFESHEDCSKARAVAVAIWRDRHLGAANPPIGLSECYAREEQVEVTP